LSFGENYWAAEAKQSLWAYRQYIDPQLVKGWWVAYMSKEFQDFFQRMDQGQRPKMMVEAPPQHGKSRGLIDAISWGIGRRPSLKCIYASFSKDLGDVANSSLQRIWGDRDKFGRVFPDLRMPFDSENEYTKNSDFIEFPGHRGYFRNTTVRGQVTGKTLGFGVVDDPIKGREEAQSKLVRDKTWNWLMDDFFSRFTDDAGFIMTMTRWHIDDPAHRWIQKFPETRVLKFPAMFRTTPEQWKNDAVDPRAHDEPLFPEYKSKAFLLERKGAYTASSWESLYQQMPIVSGGGMFPVVKFKLTEVLPIREEIDSATRYWDKAGTEAAGAYTCGVLMFKLKNGQYYVANVIRGQWSSLERERIILETAKNDAADWGRVKIWTEQEPGSGGKESAERTVAMLAGYPCRSRQGHGFERGQGRAVRRATAGRQRAGLQGQVDAGVRGRARALSQWQVQGSGGRRGRRVHEACEETLSV
jgi:phage terminase large subunit-like protein